jgi:hypothetical protein
LLLLLLLLLRGEQSPQVRCETARRRMQRRWGGGRHAPTIDRRRRTAIEACLPYPSDAYSACPSACACCAHASTGRRGGGSRLREPLLLSQLQRRSAGLGSLLLHQRKGGRRCAGRTDLESRHPSAASACRRAAGAASCTTSPSGALAACGRPRPSDREQLRLLLGGSVLHSCGGGQALRNGGVGNYGDDARVRKDDAVAITGSVSALWRRVDGIAVDPRACSRATAPAGAATAWCWRCGSSGRGSATGGASLRARPASPTATAYTSA